MRFRQTFVRTGSPMLRLLLALGLAGCSIQPVAITESSSDPTFFSELRMNYGIATLSIVAPYDTMRLTATPYSINREPVQGLPAASFYTPDTSFMSVTTDGLVRAKRTGTGLKVIATISLPGNVRHNDTTLVDIKNVSLPPRLDSLSLDPVGDSTVWAISLAYPRANNSPIDPDLVQVLLSGLFPYDINVAKYAPVWSRFGGSPGLLFNSGCGCYPSPKLQAFDSAGNAVTGIRVQIRALDPGTAVLGGASGKAGTGNPLVKNIYNLNTVMLPGGIQPGTARLEMRTFAYGIGVADTITWRITPPPLSQVFFARKVDGTADFVPSSSVIRTYGGVDWWNLSSDTVELVFDDPTNVAMPTADICQVFTDYPDIYDPDQQHCGSGNVVILPPQDSASFTGPNNDPYHRITWNAQVRQFPVAGTYRYHDARTGRVGEIIVSDN